MMKIFLIDWQQHWKYDRSMNIGANAHDKRAVSTKQPQVSDLTSIDSWAPVTSERYWVPRLFHNATVSQCDHFFCCYIYFVVWSFTRLITRFSGEGFFTSILVGGTQLQCIYYLCRILISRPPRVFRRFKRRSCYFCRMARYPNITMTVLRPSISSELSITCRNIQLANAFWRRCFSSLHTG